jgi:hypothetical protein
MNHHDHSNKAKKSEVRKLLSVIIAAVFFAFLIAFLGVYYLGPSGRYSARNVLLNPEVAFKLNYNDYNQKTGGESRFVLDSIEYAYYLPEVGSWKKKGIDQETYQKFYRLIESDTSIREISEDVINLFRVPPPASLILYVHTESDASWQEARKIFQQIDFLDKEGYYRIELREDASGAQWAYFYHPGIYQKVTQLFLNE